MPATLVQPFILLTAEHNVAANRYNCPSLVATPYEIAAIEESPHTPLHSIGQRAQFDKQTLDCNTPLPLLDSLGHSLLVVLDQDDSTL